MKFSTLFLTCTMAATILGGCRIETHESGVGDADIECDDDGVHGGGSADLADEGDYCNAVDDCGEGLLCNFVESECVLAPESCSDNLDCGTGYICEDDTCAPTAVCTEQADCDQGLVCDDSYSTCVPGDLSCAAVTDESECSARTDCEPVYAGVDCSCGPDCTCQGGEAGCVCESFEFFTCADAA